MSGETQRFVINNVIRPIGLPIYWLARRIYRLAFGWLDKRAAKDNQRKLAQDVRDTLPFLFTEYNGCVVPNIGVRLPEPFDYATVTIALDHLLLRFIRGRGELGVNLAPASAPSDWHEFPLVLDALKGAAEPQRQPIQDLWQAAVLLETNMNCLNAAFSGSEYDNLKRRLAEVYKRDRAVMREWEFETNKRIR